MHASLRVNWRLSARTSVCMRCYELALPLVSCSGACLLLNTPPSPSRRASSPGTSFSAGVL
eukprot:11185279-Lingulodinium_polyedra.AAC.1